jgi:hypothetical protein
MNTNLRHIIREELDKVLSEQRHREKIKIKDLKRFNRKIDGNRILKVYNIRVRAKGRDKITLNRKQVLDIFNKEMPDIIKKEYYSWVIGNDVRKGKNIYSYNIMILNRSSYPELEKLSPLTSYGSVNVYTTEQFEASTESNQDKSVSNDLDKNVVQDTFDITPEVDKDKYKTPEDKEATKVADKIEKRTGVETVENVLAKYVGKFVRANENYKTYVKNTVYKIKKSSGGTIVKSHWRSEIDNADAAWNGSTLVTPESIYNTPWDMYLDNYIRTADKNHEDFNIIYFVKYVNGTISKVHWMAHSPDVVAIIQKNPAWAKSDKLKKQIDAIGKKLWAKAIVIPSSRMDKYNKVMKRQIANDQKVDNVRKNKVQGKSVKIFNIYESPKSESPGDIVIVTNKNIFKKSDEITISGTTSKGPFHKYGLNTRPDETYTVTAVEKQGKSILLYVSVMPERYDAPAIAPGDTFNGSGKITISRVAPIQTKGARSWCKENGTKDKDGFYTGTCAYLNMNQGAKDNDEIIRKYYTDIKRITVYKDWDANLYKEVTQKLTEIMNEYDQYKTEGSPYYGTWKSADYVKRYFDHFAKNQNVGSSVYYRTFIYTPKNNFDDGKGYSDAPGYKLFRGEKKNLVWGSTTTKQKKLQQHKRKTGGIQDPHGMFSGPGYS